VFVYTLWLKRTSSQNIVIGGAAGAVPTLIGWTAVTGRLDWAPVVLFGVIFFWTPPHFWALAIRYREDYSAADVPMLPSVADDRVVGRQIVAYAVVVWALSVAFAPVAEMGLIYTVAAVALGAVFTGQCLRLKADPTPARAMALFHGSISYVSLLFGVMALDPLVSL
jgi:heme o synthase